MPFTFTILFTILIMSFVCPVCSYTATSMCGLSSHQNRWCKGFRDVSNDVMNAHHKHEAPQLPPAPHIQSETPFHDKASQPEFENPEPYVSECFFCQSDTGCSCCCLGISSTSFTLAPVTDSDRVRQQRQSTAPIKVVLDQDRLKRSFVGLMDSRRIRSSRLPQDLELSRGRQS
jgi:hypothetical protein